MGRFHQVWRALGRVSVAGQMFPIPTMDKLARKIKYGFEIETLCTPAENAGHN